MIRTDFTINWELSPRIITIDAPSVSCSMQDMLDTLRNEEAKTANMDNPPIVDASGKEPLGASTYVGLTVALQNARVAFEARPGPEWVICNLDGGNLVAFDEDGNVMESISPTAFVSISKTASSSATSTEQEAIQYASYQNAVWVDTLLSTTSTEYPYGTREYPVSNFVDARTIAELKGFDQFNILGSATLSGIACDVHNFRLLGQNANRTYITVDPTAITDNTEISEVTLTGTLDTNIIVRNSMVYDINYFNGVLHTTMLLPGTITLGNGADGYFLDCFSGGLSTATLPIIDMGGSGQSLAMRNFSGAVELTNKTGNDYISIDLASGLVVVDLTTVINGTITIRGVGKIIDKATNLSLLSGTYGNLIIVNETINSPDMLETILDATWEGIYIDVNNGGAGTTYPLGTPASPVNNLTDAITIAETRNIRDLYFRSDYTFPNGTYISNYKLYGLGRQETIFTFETGCILASCQIFKAICEGDIIGVIGFTDCWIKSLGSTSPVPASQEIVIAHSLLQGTFTFPVNYTGVVTVLDCWATPDPLNTPPELDMFGGAFDLQVRNLSGFLKISNCTEENDVRIFLNSGGVELDSTVTAGNFIVTGVGNLIDNSTSTTSIDESALISKTIIGQAVWDEPIADHLLPDTMGHQMYHQAYAGIVHIDATSGVSGTDFPNGTTHAPVDNLTDALSIANAHYIKTIHFVGSYTMDGEDITGLTLGADSSVGNSLTITSMTNTGTCYFQNLTVSGALSGATRFTTCVLGALTGFDGGAKNCLLTGNVTITGSGANYFTECDTYITDSSYKQLSVGNHLLNIIRCRGSWGFYDYTGSSVIAADFVSGNVLIDSTCVSGILVISGLVHLEDQSGAACMVVDASVTETGIVDEVWDELASGHTTPGSFGHNLSLPTFTCEAGTLTTTVFTTDATDPDGFWTNKLFIQFKGNITASLEGKTCLISSYTNSGGTFTVTDELPTAPAVGDEFFMINE